MLRFVVVTINILNDRALSTRWEERRALLAAGLAALNPDFIALQEVRLPENNAQWLADQLGGYSVHLCPRTGALKDKEGEAILSRWPVTEHLTLDLRSQHRAAHLARVQWNGRALALVNGHYYWLPGDPAERAHQVRRLLGWLSGLPAAMPVVICGDFNGTPESAASA